MSKSNKRNSKYEKDKKQDYIKSNEDGIKIKPLNKKKERKIKYNDIELDDEVDYNVNLDIFVEDDNETGNDINN